MKNKAITIITSFICLTALIISHSLSAIVPNNINVNKVRLEVKFFPDRNEEEIARIQKIIIQPIIDAGIKIVGSGSNYDMDITYKEDSIMQSGVGACIKWELHYILKESNKEVMRKSYDGNIRGEDVKIVEPRRGPRKMSCREIIYDIVNKLKRNPPFPPKNKIT